MVFSNRLERSPRGYITPRLRKKPDDLLLPASSDASPGASARIFAQVINPPPRRLPESIVAPPGRCGPVLPVSFLLPRR
jgi:hypothetical protein